MPPIPLAGREPEIGDTTPRSLMEVAEVWSSLSDELKDSGAGNSSQLMLIGDSASDVTLLIFFFLYDAKKNFTKRPWKSNICP